jgi:hypothetical protein
LPLCLVTAGAGAAESHFPPLDPQQGLIIGCPSPNNEFEPPQTSTDAAAVFMLVEAMTLCRGELITHGEDRELQRRLKLQEQLERIDRKRARAARQAQGRARVEIDRDAPPRG